MSNDLVERKETLPASVAEITQHALSIQQVMQAVMKPETHYGVIPGTKKPTLYKAGAEVIAMTFRIADEYQIEEPQPGKYRVTCVGRHQISGIVLGSGMGACSTSEEKYKWREAICTEEFEQTNQELRRVKYFRGKGGSFYTKNQVRTEAADLDNTALKMACKRAKIAMILNVTAASDMFSQDLEDLDDTLRAHLADDEVASDPKVGDAWIVKVKAETTADGVKKVWAEASKELRDANDVKNFNAVKTVVLSRAKEFAPAQSEESQGD